MRSSFEPRPANASATHRVPTKAQLRAFHHQSDQPYSHWVTGRFRGTTDEVIQWAAAKWGLAPDLVRAVAAKETWWRMSHVGDNGDSFGLFQVRRPFHCRGTLRLRALPPRRGAQRRLLGLDHPLLLRRQADVAEHRRGQRRALRGRRPVGLDRGVVLGALARRGRRGYVAAVKDYMARRIWRTRDFAGG